MERHEVEVDVERLECLDTDVLDEHLRTSTVFLHDILSQENVSIEGSSSPETKISAKDTLKSKTCTHCGKIYKQPQTLQRHVLLKHTDKNLSKCEECDKTYASQLSLEKHVKYMHRSHRCTVCYKVFDDSQSLEVHSEGCKKLQIPCDICGKLYASTVSLRNHMKYMHPSKTGFRCDLCRREFVSEANLINHRNTVHPAGAMDCSCGRSFISLPRLQSHVLYKHTKDIAKCHHCHKVFTSVSRLAQHLVRLHKVGVDIDEHSLDVKQENKVDLVSLKSR